MSRRQQDKYHWCFPRRGKLRDADHRAARALGQIAGQRVRRALIVSHEMIGRLLMRHILAADPATALGWNQPNDVTYQIDPRQQTR